MIAAGLLTENADGTTRITGKGIRLYESEMKKEQPGQRTVGRKGYKKKTG